MELETIFEERMNKGGWWMKSSGSGAFVQSGSSEYPSVTVFEENGSDASVSQLKSSSEVENEKKIESEIESSEIDENFVINNMNIGAFQEEFYERVNSSIEFRSSMELPYRTELGRSYESNFLPYNTELPEESSLAWDKVDFQEIESSTSGEQKMINYSRSETELPIQDLDEFKNTSSSSEDTFYDM